MLAAAAQSQLQNLLIQWLGLKTSGIVSIVNLVVDGFSESSILSVELLALKQFHEQFIMKIGMGMGRDVTGESLKETIQKLACKVLSDPRAVMRSGFPTLHNRRVYYDIFRHPTDRPWPTLAGEEPLRVTPYEAHIWAPVRSVEGDTASAAYRHHTVLLHLIFSDIHPVNQLTTEILEQEEKDSRMSQSMTGYPEDM